MKTYGYIRRSYSSQNMSVAVEQLRSAGCDDIIYDDAENYITRPNLDDLLNRKIKNGDTLVIFRFGNVIRAEAQLPLFLSMCKERGIRIISTYDGIDTEGCPGQNWHKMNMTLHSVIRSEKFECTIKKSADSKLFARTRKNATGVDKTLRNRTIASLYQEGVSLEAMSQEMGVGYSTIYRVLDDLQIPRNRHGQPEEEQASPDGQ